MDKQLTKKEISRLIRAHSNESSVSLSANKTAELSVDPFRRSINTETSQNKMSALMRTFLMEARKSLDFTECYILTDEQANQSIDDLSIKFQNEKEKINDYWYLILAIKPPNKFTPNAISLVNLVHSILEAKSIETISSLLLLNYLIIAPFWSDFGSLAVERSNILVGQIKAMIKHFTKNHKKTESNIQMYSNKIFIQTIDSIGKELYTFLLPLFQTIKKKPNYFYCFITISELIEKLHKKGIIPLNSTTLNSLELNLSKKQKVIFDEVFMKQPDPIFDKNLAMKSEMLQDYKEELFNAFMNFEYRNNISFNQLLYTFESLYNIGRAVEAKHAKAFEKCLGFKVLIKTMSEIFEYFCSKLSNLNTECLLMLDTKLEPIEYFIKFVSNKKKQELFNAYEKVNNYFDKKPSPNVAEILGNKSLKKSVEPKNKPKKNVEYSNKVLAKLKLCKKSSEISDRTNGMIDILESIKKEQEGELNNKVRHDFAKFILKLLKYAAEESTFSDSAKNDLDKMLILFLGIPEAIYSRNLLDKLKQKYEVLCQVHTLIPRQEVFILVKSNLEKMVTEEDHISKRDMDDALTLQAGISLLSADSRSSKFFESPPLSRNNSSHFSTEMDYIKMNFGEIIEASLFEPSQIVEITKTIESALEEKAKYLPDVIRYMNYTDQSLIRTEYLRLVQNIGNNVCLHFKNSPSEAIDLLKPLVSIFITMFDHVMTTTKTTISICLDDFDRIICHTFLKFTIDEKSGIIQYDANKILKIPGNEDPVYDIVYFCGFREIALEGEELQTFISEFIEELSKNKNRISTLGHIKEQAATNNTFKVYGYKEDLDFPPKSLIVSFRKPQVTKFFIIPVSYRMFSLE